MGGNGEQHEDARNIQKVKRCLDYPKIHETIFLDYPENR